MWCKAVYFTSFSDNALANFDPTAESGMNVAGAKLICHFVANSVYYMRIA